MTVSWARSKLAVVRSHQIVPSLCLYQRLLLHFISSSRKSHIVRQNPISFFNWILLRIDPDVHFTQLKSWIVGCPLKARVNLTIRTVCRWLPSSRYLFDLSTQLRISYRVELTEEQRKDSGNWLVSVVWHDLIVENRETPPLPDVRYFAQSNNTWKDQHCKRVCRALWIDTPRFVSFLLIIKFAMFSDG